MEGEKAQMGGYYMTLVDELRMYATDMHSNYGHNKISTVMSQAADRIETLERDHLNVKASTQVPLYPITCQGNSNEIV